MKQDSARTLGVVYTPEAIARSIAEAALQQFDVSPLRVLEPSVGDGAIVRQVRQVLRSSEIVAVDVDAHALAQVESKRLEIACHEGDFITYALGQPAGTFDLIIGNPPYIRRSNYNPSLTASLKALSAELEYPLAQLKNAWAAFIVAAEPLLSERGVMAFVLPYELMHVDYGIALQRAMFPKFGRVDLYVPGEKAFKQLDQDAVVMIARKGGREEGVFVHHVQTLEALDCADGRSVDYGSEQALRTSLRGALLPIGTEPVINRLLQRALVMDQLVRNHTGIVTAANDYFILKVDEVRRLGLDAWARPILKRGGYLPEGPMLEVADFQNIESHLPTRVIDFNGLDRGNADEATEAYLQLGEVRGIDKSYKALHRAEWFKVPMVAAAPGLFFKRSYSYPRLVMNGAGVLATDAAYMLHPKAPATIAGVSYSFYNSFTLLMCELIGRFYGGGVLEITPNEFRKLPVFYTEPSVEQFSAFCSPSFWRDLTGLVAAGDKVLEEQHGISRDDLIVLNLAWLSVRGHRLRHGSSQSASLPS